MEACWGSLIGATNLDVVPPLPAVDLSGLQKLALTLAAGHDAAGMTWWPETQWAGVSAVSRVLIDSGAAGITVGSIEDAILAVGGGTAAVVVSVPPVVGGQPHRFTDLCRSASAAAVCDHFAQAERIAQACRSADVTGSLLLRVDVGRHRLGIRPGPDLGDLAGGIASLRGVRLAGLWVGGPATGAGRLAAAELSRLLRRCRSSLERSGHAAARVSVGRLDEIEGDAASATETRTPAVSEADRCTAIVAGVVGRPTRDQAVVDAGTRSLGKAAIALGRAGGAEVTYIDEDFTVLRLADGRQELAIGDLVALRPKSPVRLRPGGPVLVHDRGAWRVERSAPSPY